MAKLHIYSKGDKVIFRTHPDYVAMNNIIACAGYTTETSILALSIMSTHFHLIVENDDPDLIQMFISQIKRNYAFGYNSRYDHSIQGLMKVSSREIDSLDSLKDSIIYVLRNPAHHFVCVSPMDYEYSSARFTFLEDLAGKDTIDHIMSYQILFRNLNARTRKMIAGRNELPDGWLVNERNMISPLSYMNLKRTRACWNYRPISYLIDMDKRLKDANQNLVDSDVLSLRSFGRNNIDVCEMIDSMSHNMGVMSFHHLSPGQVGELRFNLAAAGIHPTQIDRCLW